MTPYWARRLKRLAGTPNRFFFPHTQHVLFFKARITNAASYISIDNDQGMVTVGGKSGIFLHDSTKETAFVFGLKLSLGTGGRTV